MRIPAQTRTGEVTRTQTSVLRSYIPPVGGWNARDALAEMAKQDAVTLENWFPRPSYCEFRGGYASHATGMSGNGKTLMTYNKLTGTNEFYCATSAGIYNVSSAGAVGASVLTRTNGKHQWIMMGNGTDNYLIACNGVDKPAYYDGVTWTAVDNATTPALTGITTTTLISPMQYQGRLFFIQVQTLSVWYLASGAIGGALTEFDFSAEFKRGGYLMAIHNWTRDAGDGQDDVFVAVSSEGEAVVYQGNNPSVAANWAKIGTFYVGRPLGRRCMTQLGGDVMLLTENGVFELSKALQSVAIDYKLALSDKIVNAFTDAARSYSSIFGWETIIYPAYSALIVNVPWVEDGTHEQYVMNTITKAWCKFTGWNAEDFGIFNGELYFTSGTTVWKAWTGTSDNSTDIVYYGKQAFQNFGDMRQKKILMFMPILSVNGTITYNTDVDVDFEDDTISGTATYTVVSGGVWNVNNWNDAYWASGLEVVRQWSSPAEWTGVWLACKLKINSTLLKGQWTATQIMYAPGGMI